MNKKQPQKVRAPIKLTCHRRQQLYISLQQLSDITNSLTEIDPHITITNKPEESNDLVAAAIKQTDQ